MRPIVYDNQMDRAFFVKGLIDEELTVEDGFESHLFNMGVYNNAVGSPFKLPYDPDTVCVLIISTPNMFDVSFKRWIQTKFKEVTISLFLFFYIGRITRHVLTYPYSVKVEYNTGYSTKVFFLGLRSFNLGGMQATG
ncbi:unnamed protein product [Haemonchus placei]|uniref:Cyanocobalamin reductase (cyanide-eliminating) n=1 Tax=Haemonchus placei TaxID=6290 RepID=A0A0N4VTR0_HAEPC|nr:unnamed protein product [Haemonchus placei]